MALSSPLSWFVPYKLDTDDREPLFVVGGVFGVFAPSLVFWVQVLGVVLLQAFFCALLSIPTYLFIVKNKSRWRYAVGYLVLIPLWLILPGLQLRLLQIHNKVVNFCLSGLIPTLSIFHTMEGTCVGVVMTFI
jgi:ABC-type spermidine/putrescine transport system permease subunit I